MQKDVADKRGVQHLLARVQGLIGQDLLQVEAIMQQELAAQHPFVVEVLAHLAGYRGKRLRPMLVLLAGHACGQCEHPHHVLAAVTEMIHTATLVHDDVLDDATTRRHVATINSRWTNETSVLLGDYLFTHAFHLTSSLGSAEACRLIGRATNIVCAGELWQIGERGNLDLAEEQYFDIIEAKTAELCAISCALGAQWAGASEDVIQALDGYGRDLGIAFQIVDDLLDVQGQEQVTGKTLGSDLRQQKLTLPLIHLLQQAPPAEAAAVRQLIAQPDAHTPQALWPYFEKYGALRYARHRAEEMIVAARQKLQCLPETPARQLLEDMAEFVTARSA